MGVTKLTEDILNERHKYGTSLYSEWRDFAKEVERVYKGDFGPSDPASGSLEIVRPSEGYAITHKFLRMLSLRSHISYESVRQNDTQKEMERCDRIERVVRGYYTEHRFITQRNVHRDAVFFALLRGRGAIQTLYDPSAQLKIRQEALDPFEYFPVYGKEGPRWFTTERYMRRMELWDYFAGLTDEQLDNVNLPDIWYDPDENDDYKTPWDWIPVIEYWDDTWFGWKVQDTLVSVEEHGYGFVPLAEIRLNSTPLDEERWANMALIGAAVEDLKHMATLKSKMATGVEQFYFPRMYYQDVDGNMHVADANTPVGTFGEVSPEFKPIVLNPNVNHEALQLLMSNLQAAIGNTTINPVVFNTDLSNTPSGFSVSQFLSIVKDDLADYVDGIQSGLSVAASHLLQLMYAKADEQEGGKWSFPVEGGVGRKSMESVTAEDLDGHFRVNVGLRVDLPQDTLQKSAIFNQIFQTDPQTGRPRVDFETAVELSGLDYSIEDIAAMKKRIDYEYLKNVDEETKLLEIARIKAEHQHELDEWRRVIEKADNAQARREEKRVERDIERGLSRDVIVPAEIAADAMAMYQYASLVEQGMTPDAALQMVLEGGPPMGVPGEQMLGAEAGPPPEEDPELAALIQSLFGADTQTAPPLDLPDGFTGYEGIDPQVLPAPMQGAMPRQQMDQARLAIENNDDLMSRGGLPERR